MKFSDLIREMNLEVFGGIALLLFIVAFLAVCARTLSRKRDADYDRAGHLPLEEDAS
jgi:cbb3-type cytochrome oxidase subunit 3